MSSKNQERGISVIIMLFGFISFVIAVAFSKLEINLTTFLCVCFTLFFTGLVLLFIHANDQEPKIYNYGITLLVFSSLYFPTWGVFKYRGWE